MAIGVFTLNALFRAGECYYLIQTMSEHELVSRNSAHDDNNIRNTVLTAYEATPVDEGRIDHVFSKIYVPAD